MGFWAKYPKSVLLEGAPARLTPGSRVILCRSTFYYNGTYFAGTNQKPILVEVAADEVEAAFAGKDVEDVTDQVYGAPPTVVSVTPASAATSVALDVHPTITFSNVMNQNSITPDSILFYRFTGTLGSEENTGFVSAASFAWSEDGKTVTVTPFTPFPDGYNCQIQVTTEVEDAFGNNLAEQYDQPTGFTLMST